MTTQELQDILEKHKKWLNQEPDGVRADLRRRKIMKYTFPDGTSVKVSSDEKDMYQAIKNLINAQAEKTRAEAMKLTLDNEERKCKIDPEYTIDHFWLSIS